MKTFIKTTLFTCAWLTLGIMASGCATYDVKSTQIITKAMVIQPAKPPAPNPETATQRDVAVYITLLRGWGNAMSTQLKAIEELITSEEK